MEGGRREEGGGGRGGVGRRGRGKKRGGGGRGGRGGGEEEGEERGKEKGKREKGGKDGRITYATFPSDESFEPTDAVVYLTGEGLAEAPGVAQAEPRVSLLNQIDYTFVSRVLPAVSGAEGRFRR